MIKKLRFLIAISFFININAPTFVHASFDDMGVGGRATGMADAFVGVADNADAMVYNPAGLVNVLDGEISTEYSQFLKGLNDGSSLSTTYLGYAHPLQKGKKGVLGFSYHNFKASNLLSERTLLFSYGWKLKVAPFGWGGMWSTGVSLKQLHRQYEPDRFTENALNDVGVVSGQSDPLFAKNGYSKDAYALDAGALVNFGEKKDYSAGLMLRNVNQPDVSLGNSGDKAPFGMKLGLAYKPKWGVLSSEVRRTNRLANQPDTDYALGAERKFLLQDNNAFAIRGGYSKGSREYKLVTAGVSYLLGRAEMDYAFIIPVGNTSSTTGSHRIGLTFKLGGAGVGKDLADQQNNSVDLLAAFALDSMAAHVIAQRSFNANNTSSYKRMLILQLLMKKYASTDAGLLEIGNDLANYIDNPAKQLISWPDLKLNLFNEFSDDGRITAEDAVEYMKRGDANGALARLLLLSNAERASAEVKALSLISMTELAAQSYRAGDINTTLERMRSVVEALPNDAVVMAAYRKLLLMKTTGIKATPATPAVTTGVISVPAPSALPEAPAALTAPVQVTGDVKQISASDLDVMTKTFGTLLGYYLTRKQAGAPVEERRVLLNQMRALFVHSGMDMSLVNMELAGLGKESTPAALPVATPKSIVTPVEVPKLKQPEILAPKPVAKPAATKEETTGYKQPVVPATNAEMDRAWAYYRQAVERGITDSERIELLESMLRRWGEASAEKIVKELERVKRRIE